MLDMLLNLQPQAFAEGKAKESGEKQVEKLLQELGLGKVDGVKDFVSMLEGEQQALTEKGFEEAKQVVLDLGNSGKEAASELGLEILSQLSQSQDAHASNGNAELQAKLSAMSMQGSNSNSKEQAVELINSEKEVQNVRPQSLLEKLGLAKEAPRGEKTAHSDSILKEVARLRASGPDITLAKNTKSKGMIQKPALVSAEDFLGQKQLQGVDPEVGLEQAKAKVSAQMLQKYENGQKVVDRQMISLKGPTPQVSTEGLLKSSNLSLDDEAQALDSSKVLKDVGLMKVPDAPKAAGNNANNIDMGKANTLDMGKLDMSKPQQVIDRIVEYIDKAQFERTQKLDLVVKHEKLGQFHMQVSKSGVNSELIDLKIQAQGAEIHNFFKEHELDLMKTLSKNGVRLGDFKLTQGPENSSFSQSSDNNKDGQTGQGQKFFQGQDQDKDQANKDSQRRRTLWEQYQERYGA